MNLFYHWKNKIDIFFLTSLVNVCGQKWLHNLWCPVQNENMGPIVQKLLEM